LYRLYPLTVQLYSAVVEQAPRARSRAEPPVRRICPVVMVVPVVAAPIDGVDGAFLCAIALGPMSGITLLQARKAVGSERAVVTVAGDLLQFALANADARHEIVVDVR
jgi:hypothetical protein